MQRPPFGRPAPADDRGPLLQRADAGHRQDFDGGADANLGEVVANVGECLGHPRDVDVVREHLAGAFDVAGAELRRRYEKLLADLVGGGLGCAGFEPVAEELDLDVLDAVVVEHPFHRRIADGVLLHEQVLDDEAHPRVTRPRRRLDAVAQRDRAYF